MRLTEKLIEPLAWYLPKLGYAIKPRVIQFPVNDICNARCQMCNIWQQKLGYQISAEELARILDDPLFSEVRIVGINGGEPTLRKDLSEIIKTLFENLPRLEQISLITNGLVAKKVIPSIESLRTVTRAYDARLSVMVSLDGVDSTHDLVRGRKGNYSNALKVIEAITSSNLCDQLALGCTVVKDNVYGLFDLQEMAENNGIYIKYRVGIPHQRLYSDHVKDPFALSDDEKYHLCNFIGGVVKNYEKSEKQQYFYRSLIQQIIEKAGRKAGCDWQFRGVTITADSKLLYCAVKSPELGDLRQYTATSLFREGRKQLKRIVKEECDSCLHDYVGPLPTTLLFKSIIKTGIKRTLPREGNKLFRDAYVGMENLAFARRRKTMRRVGKKGRKSPATTRKRVLICGWYGTETIGDIAILGGIVQQLDVFQVDITVASLYTPLSDHTRRNNLELAHVEVRDIYGDEYLVSDFDLLVFGGGPIMGINNLAEIESLALNGKQTGVPFVVAGCGVGPLGNRAQNSSIRRILDLADWRIFRDKESKEIAGRLTDFGEEDLVAEDPAFSWAASQNERELQTTMSKVSSDVVRVAMGLRDWPHAEYASQYTESAAREKIDHFEECLAYTLRKLATSQKIELVPVIMCQNYLGGDDRWYYQKFFRKYPDLRDHVDPDSGFGRESNLETVYRQIRSSDFMISMRYHSLVLSLGAGVPVVAIDYTGGKGKVSALCDARGVPNVSITDIDREVFADMCIEKIRSGRQSEQGTADCRLIFPSCLSSVLEKVL